MGKSFAVIICAAGASSRFGGKRSKPFVNVAGRAAFLHSVDLFSNRDDVKQILLAISHKDEGPSPMNRSRHNRQVWRLTPNSEAICLS